VAGHPLLARPVVIGVVVEWHLHEMALAVAMRVAEGAALAITCPMAANLEV
jgi:hypothetical protein